jgi:hypothetical protein
MRRVILIASALLPHPIRGRYREQWLADLRDAPEAGVGRGQIAWGALAFAATAPRPWPAMSFDNLRARRVGFALALAAALLGLTTYPGYSVGGILPAPWGLLQFAFDTLVVALQVLGPIVAVVVVSAVRETPWRERAGVRMLALAAAAPLVPALLGRGDNLYLYPAALAYPAAVALILAALGLRHSGAPSRYRPRAVVGAAALVASAGLGGVSLAAIGWIGRVPLVTSEPVGSALYEEWLRLKVEFEQRVDVLLVASAITVVVLVAAVTVIGILGRPVSLTAATIGAALLAVFGSAQLVQFLVLATPTAGWVDGPGVMGTLVRLATVVAVLATIDGVRQRLPRSPGAVDRRPRTRSVLSG